jgi:peptide-methionine (S)-S-oxide reductase
MSSKNEIAVFGGGCFWCTEAIFNRVKGVTRVTSGYAGGEMDKPSYEDVSSSQTGHAEVIKVEFDPTIITYEDLLDIFFHTHDPTTKDKQGADVGSQYRSLILTTSQSQEELSRNFKDRMEKSGEYRGPITTEIRRLTNFYNAEKYHEDYYHQHPDAPYCQLVIAPKIKKFLEKYPDKAKTT